MANPSDQRVGSRPLFVFAHPNHEIALYGCVQRWKPHILFLTDGGAGYRPADTKTGLHKIGHYDFQVLPFGEDSFYNAFLEGNLDFFRKVSTFIRRRIEDVSADWVICDAVEFFNPIHDIVRPLVERALRGSPMTVFEAPITYQSAEGGFRFQHPMPWRSTDVLEVRLEEWEYSRKIHAWDEIYLGLRKLIGPMVGSPEEFRVERLIRGGSGVPHPSRDCILRYEDHGEALRQAGKVDTTITHKSHYIPVARGLLDEDSSLPRLEPS